MAKRSQHPHATASFYALLAVTLVSLTGCGQMSNIVDLGGVNTTDSTTPTPTPTPVPSIAAPTFTQDFTTALSPVFRFSRTSPGTYINAQGYLVKATGNLLLQSQDLDNVAWTKTAMTATAEAAIAPDLGPTAEKLIEDNTTADHKLLPATALTGMTAGTTYTFSVYLKPGERSKAQLTIAGTGFTNQSASFDLAARNVIASANTPTNYGISDVGGGWSRVWVTAIAGAAGTAIPTLVLLDDAGATPYLGAGAGANQGLYAWGAQFEAQAAPTSYVYTQTVAAYSPRFDYDPSSCASGICTIMRGLVLESTRANNALRSETFDQTASWTVSNLSVVANSSTVMDPTGSLNIADLIVENGSTGVAHKIQQGAISSAANTLQTASIFVKPNGRTRFKLKIYRTANTADYVEAYYDTGLVSTACLASGGTANAASVQARVMALRNNWYRLELTGIATTGASPVTWEISLVDTACNTTYTGDGTSGAYLFGAQYETSGAASTYITTTTAAATRQGDTLTANYTGSWLNGSEGTAMVTYQNALDNQTGGTNYPAVFRLCDITNCLPSRIELQIRRNTPAVYMLYNNAQKFSATFSNQTVLTTGKLITSYKLGNMDAASAGVLGVNGQPDTVPPLTQFVVAPQQIWLRKFDYWSTKLSNDNLSDLSK